MIVDQLDRFIMPSSPGSCLFPTSGCRFQNSALARQGRTEPLPAAGLAHFQQGLSQLASCLAAR